VITCPLCPRHCVLHENQTGFCCARKNQGGVLVPLGYGKLTSLALDPIEKKPLNRFHPGSKILSAGGFGCNMACFFCQNAEISNAGADDVPIREIGPEALVNIAESLKPRGNIGLAFTYNEPLINLEFILDCFRLLKQMSMNTVLVTNGCFCADAMGDLFGLTDAMNIDLKGFTSAWYRRLGGDLDTVREFIKTAFRFSHIEITTLIVPGENDSPEEMEELSAWLASLSPEIPLHISRFFPRHQASGYSPTSVESIQMLCGVARNRLTYVYPGNI
jgi:pyruvate formate lyase activating enzyme